jgi:hypothetical protein
MIQMKRQNNKERWTEEARKEVSERFRKYWSDPDNLKRTRKKQVESRTEYYKEHGAWNKGKKHSQETKDKISQSMKGHKTSNETRMKMKEGQQKSKSRISQSLKKRSNDKRSNK